MATKKVNAIIERSSDGGYGVYCPDIEGTVLCGYGHTEEEAKHDLQEVLEMNIEHFKEIAAPLPKGLNDGDIEFEYSYDFSGFFQAYPVFNVSELAKYIGINPSLLRRYKTGEKFASKEQKKKIETGVHALAEKLSTVSF
jgi:predicted RNase H-like HicB family nuclease